MGNEQDAKTTGDFESASSDLLDFCMLGVEVTVKKGAWKQYLNEDNIPCCERVDIKGIITSQRGYGEHKSVYKYEVTHTQALFYTNNEYGELEI